MSLTMSLVVVWLCGVVIVGGLAATGWCLFKIVEVLRGN
jgi:hypothetical protein